MTRLHPIRTNFTAGELSPRIFGRMDLQKYNHGCEVLRNAIPMPHGPAYRRPGSHFVAEVKTSAKKTALIPFIYSTEQAYILEMGDLYTRFFKNSAQILDGGSPQEIVTPFAEAKLFELKFAQSADVLYFAHNDYAPRKLERRNDPTPPPAEAWQLNTIDFLPPPTYEPDTNLAINLTLGATSGLNVTATLASAGWFAADVGRLIIEVDSDGNPTGGRATIRTVAAGPYPVTGANVDIHTAFSATALNQNWRLQGSPAATCTPSARGPVGAIITLTLSSPAEGWRTADVGKYVLINDGVCKIIERTSDSVMRAEVLATLNATTGAIPGAWRLEVNTWDATRGFPAAVTLLAQRSVWAGSKKEPDRVWFSVVGDHENHARGTEDSDAIVAPFGTNEVNVIRWLVPMKVLFVGTMSGEFKIRGATDKAITPTNIQVDPETANGSANVPALRVGHEAVYVDRSKRKVRSIAYDLEQDAYTSDDLLIFSEHLTAEYDIVQMAFQRAPDPILWAVRSDGTLLSLTYEKKHEVFAWSRHIFGAVTTDKFGNEVPLADFVESVAVIPHPDGDRDQVWLVVRRLINGATKRYVEYLDDKGNPYSLYKASQVDAGLYYDGEVTSVSLTLSDATVGTGRTVTASGSFFISGDVGKEIWHPSGRGSGYAVITAFVSGTQVTAEIKTAFPSTSVATGWFLAVPRVQGLDHLRGRTVSIVGDGAVYPSQAVPTSGTAEVTLDPPAALIEVGVQYDTMVKPVRPEVAIAGTSQGRKKHWSDIRVRVLRTLGAKVNGEQIPFRSSADKMDEPPALFTGDVEKRNLGYDEDGYVIVEQTQPLPLTVVCIYGTLQVGE